MAGIQSGFDGHAKGACDNLASATQGKLDRRQASIPTRRHSLAGH
ncbi:hypothetical protein [Pseudomonas azotoformans]|nr:hypothetical protein [Pseudomonas azotoformans]